MIVSDIVHYFITLIHDLSYQLAGGEPMAKGLVTVGILGGVVALCRNLPEHMKDLFHRQFSVSIKAEDTWGGHTRDIYRAVSEFVSTQQKNKTFIAYSKDDVSLFGIDNISLRPDYMKGFFFYRGRPFYFQSERAQELGSVPASISLRTIGRDVDTIWNAVKIVDRINSGNKERKFYTSEKSDWTEAGPMGESSAIFLPPAIKDAIDKKVDFFVKNKAWYEKRGISHKLLIILYGEHGTGKSRISRYVADRAGYSLATMDGGVNLVSALRKAATSRIVVSIPDFDTMSIASSRGINNSVSESSDVPSMDEEDIKEDKPTRDGVSSFVTDMNNLTLGSTLNFFQGDIPLNNSIVVMSTNCIDKIDSALLRRGRCDLLLEIGRLKYPEASAFYQHHYGTSDELPYSFKNIEIKACDLMGCFEDHPFDKDEFLDNLEEFNKHPIPVIQLVANQ